ncbi:MAG: chemotaxis protein CheA [Pseudobacteriovorax sp.]|nr:chemotaxis protein CheA [Pseudobacteriovorax sp.]
MASYDTDELKETFLIECEESLDRTECFFMDLESNPTDRNIINQIFRLAHSIKGSAKSVGFDQLGELTHALEELLVLLQNGQIQPNQYVVDTLLSSNDLLRMMTSNLREDYEHKTDTSVVSKRIKTIMDGFCESEVNSSSNDSISDNGLTLFSETETDLISKRTDHEPSKLRENQRPMDRQSEDKDEFIRLSLKKIESLIDNLGEQVILQSSLEEAAKNPILNEDLISKTISQLGKITLDLQKSAMALRMVPVQSLYQKTRRIIRDTSRSLGKPVEIMTKGEETEIDKVFVDELSSVVSHIIRNAIDHGIENQEERLEARKPERAKIKLNAYQSFGYFLLEIADDGRGIDTKKIYQKAMSKGLLDDQKSYSDEELINLIFTSGFSTAQSVTDVSGRGVGMDAVLSKVKSLKGDIKVISKPGIGTTFTIRLPLSIAIFNGIVFTLCGDRFVLPSTDIHEVYWFSEKQISRINENKSIITRGDEVIELVDFEKSLGIKKRPFNDSKRMVSLIVEINRKKMGLKVDDIIGQVRVVQKRLGHELKELRGVSGGAILGDGEVALVLNLSSLQDDIKNAA